MFRSSLYFFFSVNVLFSLRLQAGDKIDFDREIRPILSEYCFQCHGPDSNTREANLRLDTREGIFAKLEDGGRAVIAGSSKDSAIFRLMTSHDKEKIMPPVKSKRTVKPEEIEKLKLWIDQGAEWTEHWAFRPVKQPEVPVGEDKAIDAFVAKRAKAAGLELSVEASRTTLIRRVSLDLTGLPPTPAEVEAFIADGSPDAYEKLVDRLLASPRYGERMAWEWLDAARYADTDGFQNDPTRSMWPWRDWLVTSLNDNMRFDQFTKEMIAGDMLPYATPEQRLASAFNRNHTYNNEGGRIPEETRVENVMDRVETTSMVWLGLTVGCARCHDHKYDPITHADYFSLYDIFNQTSESGKISSGSAAPTMQHVTVEHRELLNKIKSEREKVNEMTETDDSEKWQKLGPLSMNSRGGAHLTKFGESGFRSTGKNPKNDVYEIFSTTSLQKLQSLRLEALQDPDHEFKGVGRDINGNFVLTRLSLHVRPIGKPGTKFEEVSFSKAEADHTQKSFSPNHVIDNNAQTLGWAVDGHVSREPRTAIFTLANPVESTTGFEIKITLEFQSKFSFHNLAVGRLSVSSDLQSPTSSKKKRLAELNERENSIRKNSLKVMIMDSLPQNKRRNTYVLAGGAYDKPTDQQVKARPPEFLGSYGVSGEFDRLKLAEWLISPGNPLTARVTVNRYWQTFFGKGLVSTSEDFGSQGAKPTHSDLLDWLASEFIKSGWDVKALHRKIVISRTYRQSSQVKAKSQELDPENKLYTYAPRFRMPSWMLRDQALAVSGLLNPKMGGPGVRPYQPAGVWAEATFGKINYKADTNENIYRRSIYIFWRRIVGPTMFFDTAKRQECEVLPSRTNTPMHALTTLNEPLFIESARVMAERVLKKRMDQRIDFAFRLVASRQPNKSELKLLNQTLNGFVVRYKESPESALELLSVGDSVNDKKLDPALHAAWASLCSVLLNLDETLTKE